MACAHVLERVGEPVEWIDAVDDGRQLARLEELAQRLHVVLRELREEESRRLAREHGSQPAARQMPEWSQETVRPLPPDDHDGPIARKHAPELPERPRPRDV